MPTELTFMHLASIALAVVAFYFLRLSFRAAHIDAHAEREIEAERKVYARVAASRQ